MAEKKAKTKKLKANMIRAKLVEKNMMQRDLANILGVSEMTIVNKLDEKKGSRFSVNEFVTIMDILELKDINKLFTDIEDERC